MEQLHYDKETRTFSNNKPFGVVILAKVYEDPWSDNVVGLGVVDIEPSEWWDTYCEGYPEKYPTKEYLIKRWISDGEWVFHDLYDVADWQPIKSECYYNESEHKRLLNEYNRKANKDPWNKKK